MPPKKYCTACSRAGGGILHSCRARGPLAAFLGQWTRFVLVLIVVSAVLLSKPHSWSVDFSVSESGVQGRGLSTEAGAVCIVEGHPSVDFSFHHQRLI